MATYTPRYGLSKPENTDEMQSFMSDYASNMDKIDENLGGGGGSANIVELTQAEYDALPDTKLTDDTMYLIKDANSASDAEFTHVYGFYIDETNKLFEGTMTNFTQTLEYTATEDAIALVDYSGSSGTNQWFLINNVIIPFQVLSSGRDSFTVPIRKGDKISARHTSDNEGCYFHLVVYGVKTGSEVTFLSEYASTCYSTIEREVGCWTDGKPLYQKAFTGLSVVLGSDWVNAIDISSMDMENCILGIGVVSNSYQTPLCTRINGNYLQTYMNGMGGVTITTIVIQYTKTTDVAGSGQWTPMAQPTHHYSTSEQVIGTWTNGKPCYEITLEDSGSFVSNTEHIISIPLNAENVRIMSGFVDIGTDWLPISLTLGLGTSSTNGIYCYPNKTNGLHLFSSAWTFTKYSIVIQYTKTTD